MNNKKIQKILKNIHVKPLTLREQDLVWERIRFDMTQTSIQKAVHSRAISPFKKSIAITLIFGLTAGTAFAADSAKPGDRLFVIDRALEGIQMSVASEEKKDDLRVKFALERVKEVKEIFKEIDVHSTNTSIKVAPVTPKEDDQPTETSAEESVDTPPETDNTNLETEITDDVEVGEITDLDIETVDEPEEIEDTPVVTEDIEVNPIESEEGALEETATEDQDTKTEPESPSDTTKDILSSDETPEPVGIGENPADTTDDPANMSDIEHIEDQLEQVGADASLSDGDKKRIELALGTALSFLGDVKGELIEQENTDAVSYIDLMLEQLNNEIASLPENVVFEINLSAKKETVKFEITSQDDKPKVQIEVQEKDNVAQEIETEPIQKEKTEPAKSTLEIKEGGLKITSQEEVVEDIEKDVEEGESVDIVDIDIDETKDGDGAEKKENEDGTLLDVEVVIEKAEGEENEEGTTEDESLKEELPEEESTDTTEVEPQEKDDGTTTVKMIIEQWEGDLEISVTDQGAGLHDIIEEYTDEKGDV